MVGFQSTSTSVGRSLWNRSCGDRNCSRRATVPLGIDTLITKILVFFLFGRPLVKQFALCYRTVVDLSVCLSVCLSCPVLSATLVYCSQTVGAIKMKLGMEIGLGPAHIVLDGDPALPPSKGHNMHSPTIFGGGLLHMAVNV